MRGYEQSRRDDLEAVGYVLMYFLRGSLPWQGLSGKNKEERYRRILNKKLDTSAYDLCYQYPSEFETYIDYTRKMEYVEQPDYNMIRKLFLQILEKEGQNFDYIYDWTTDEEKELRKKEFLEEKNAEKTRKNNTNERQSSKIESEDLNEESKVGDKYREDGIFHKSKSKEIKSNYKFATKESSLDVKNLNNNAINNNKKHTSKHKNNSHRRRTNRRENEGELQRENEEVCCSEACVII